MTPQDTLEEIKSKNSRGGRITPYEVDWMTARIEQLEGALSETLAALPPYTNGGNLNPAVETVNKALEMTP